MKSRAGKKISLLLLPVIYTVVLLLIFVCGGRSGINAVLAQTKATLITGTPQYQYNVDQKEVIADAAPVIGEQYGEIIADSAGIDVPLYYGDTDIILDQGAGTYTGSTLPGQDGVTLIGAHDTSFFAGLDQLAVGDTIRVQTISGSYEYTVSETKIAKATDQSAYDLNGDADSLILYTCYPLGDTSTSRDERYFVYAEK